MSMGMEHSILYALFGIIFIAAAWETEANDGRKCFSFPEGLEVEEDVVTDASPWKNQCREGSMIHGIWSQKPEGLMQDMKCCAGSVDHSLSVMIFDLHYKSNGSSQIDQDWNVQCPDNHAMTGVKVVGDKIERHLAGIKCSTLLNKKVNLQECFRINFANFNGVVRDPNLIWSVECPAGTTLVGLYDSHHFTSLKYGKCCKVQDIRMLNNLELDCPVSQINQCGWTLSRDTSLSWGYFSSDTGNVHYLYLSQTASSGTARILSPGYSAVNDKLCFRLSYMLRLYAAIRIYMKSSDPDKKIAHTEEVGYLTKSVFSIKQKDFILQPKGNFQVIVEGQRLRLTASTVMITNIAFVKMADCNVDRCSPPYKGCAANEVCLPSGPQGFKTCVCKRGYNRINGVCTDRPVSTNGGIVTAATTPPVTIVLPTTGGQHRSGDGKTDGSGEKKPDKGGGSGNGGGATDTKKKTKSLQNHAVSFNPWVYTAVGAVCGTLLVMFLLFAFLAYRKRRLHNHRYGFDFNVNYLRPRTLSGSFLSENNNSYVPEPTVQISCTEIVNIPEKTGGNVPIIEYPDENRSTISSTPPSHHYFEVEPECDLNRKTSQATLTFPLYGSSEDITEECIDGEKFLEPPSDEQELCAQLNKEIDRRELDILPEKQLGQGAFGYVHLGMWHKSDGEKKVVAIKSMKDSGASEERIKFLQEAAIMKQFAHQNVVFMFGVVTKRYPPMIVLEYMQNGNLRKYLSRERRSRKKRSLESIDRDLHRTFLRMAREIVAGMTYLAGMQFVHRDLAARNILLDQDMVCKIGDFGLARDLIGCEHYISQGGRIPVKWTSPEAIAYRRYSTASDVWSFGVLLYEMWSIGKKPYEELSNDEVIEKVCNGGYRLPPPKDCPRVIYHLMIDCWHPEEAKRPRFSQIKYCLAQSDARLLGRGSEIRQRSVTSSEMECDTIKEDTYGELQNSYCKTD